MARDIHLLPERWRHCRRLALKRSVRTKHGLFIQTHGALEYHRSCGSCDGVRGQQFAVSVPVDDVSLRARLHVLKHASNWRWTSPSRSLRRNVDLRRPATEVYWSAGCSKCSRDSELTGPAMQGRTIQRWRP